MIKAIETQYKGYRFRSRLEARWAVFFDALDIKWEYEKEGYDLGEYGYYLPDFYIPDLPLWIEVKGQQPTDAEESKAFQLSNNTDNPILIVGDVGSIWNAYHSYCDEIFDINLPCVSSMKNIITNDPYGYAGYGWLMNCPMCGNSYTHTGRVDQCDGQDDYKAWAGRGNAIKINMYCEQGCSWVFVMGFHKGETHICIENPIRRISDPLSAMFGDRPRIEEAIIIARSARFEHGETPQIKPIKAAEQSSSYHPFDPRSKRINITDSLRSALNHGGDK